MQLSTALHSHLLLCTLGQVKLSAVLWQKGSRIMSNIDVKSNREANHASKSVVRAASTVSGWTMLSRVLGFVRDIILARVLGAGILADAFFVAFKLPNFFRRLFAEGTLTVALVPVLTDERKSGEEQAHSFLNAMAGLLLLALTIITVAGTLAMPWLLMLFAPGFADEPDRWQQTLLLARWMFPYLAFISLTAMAWAVLNTYKRFSLAAASPALLNVALIFAAVVLAPNMENPALALAFGVLLGGVLQLGIQFPALKKLGWVPRPRLDLKMAAVRRTLKLFATAVLGIAAIQINILVGTILATLLPVGSVSFLYYADRIMELPLALFGIAMGTAILPTLSEHMSNGDRAAAKYDLSLGLAWLAWLTLPALAGMIWLAGPIIATLFEHGKFTAADTLATAHALQAYGVGLVAFCWVRVLAAACYAEKDAATPTRYAAYGVATNIVLAIILMQFFAHVGLALATSLAAFVNATLLFLHIRRSYGGVFEAKDLKRIGRAVVATLIMVGFLFVLGLFWSFPVEGKLLRAIWLCCAVGGGVIAFFAAAWLLGEKSLLKMRRGKPV